MSRDNPSNHMLREIVTVDGVDYTKGQEPKPKKKAAKKPAAKD